MALSGAVATTGVLAGLYVALAGSAWAADGGARPRLCPQDAPEGVRLPHREGCDTVSDRQRAEPNGFRDLGNGVKLRVGGRSSLDVYSGR